MANPVGTGEYELSADRTQLQKDLDAAKQDVAKSGADAEKGFSSAFSNLGGVKAGLLAVGTTAAAGFGLATKGALEAQAAGGAYAAQTGANAQQTRAFIGEMDGLAGSAGAVGKSFGDIADVGTQVENQFGTNGKQTQDLTGYLLDFAKASGQDAKGAVLGLNDTMAAYGLSTDDATGFMDQLIASHQKFGTDIGPQAIGTMQNMAGAVQSLGGNADDAVGFLNLMETAGVDAAGALKGLNTAAAKAPDGSTLQGLFDHLASIQDQGDRTKEAVKLFGTQAGVKLALAIKPGQSSLDDFKVSAQDAQGATQKAAEGMQTDSDKIRGALDKITAGAREVGTDFGPAITGLASLGSLAAPLIAGAKDLLEKFGIQILPKAAAVGAAEGAAQAEGATGSSVLSSFLAKFGLMTPAKVAAATAAGQAEGAAEGEAAAAAMKGPGALAGAASAGTALAIAAAGAGAVWFASRGINDIFGGPGSQKGYQDAAYQAIDAYTATLDTNLRGPFADKVKAAYQDGISKGLDPQSALAAAQQVGAEFLAGTTTALSGLPGAIGPVLVNGFNAAAIPAATAAGTDTGAAFITHTYQPIQRGLDVIPPMLKATLGAGARQAATAAANQLADQKIWAASAQAITGDLAGTLEKGASSDIQSAMDKVTWAIDHPLQLEKQAAEIQAALTSKKMQVGLASQNPEIRTTAEQQQQYLIGLWQNLTGKAWTTSTQTSQNLDNGLSSHYPDIKTGARGLVNDVNSIFDALKTNYSVSVAYHAGQIAKNDLPHFAAGGFSRPGELELIGENGPELRVFGEPGTIVSNEKLRALLAMPAPPRSPVAPTASATAAGPTPERPESHVHYHYEVAVQGFVEAKTPEDIGRQLRRLGAFGGMPKAPQPFIVGASS